MAIVSAKREKNRAGRLSTWSGRQSQNQHRTIIKQPWTLKAHSDRGSKLKKNLFSGNVLDFPRGRCTIISALAKCQARRKHERRIPKQQNLNQHIQFTLGNTNNFLRRRRKMKKRVILLAIVGNCVYYLDCVRGDFVQYYWPGYA